ncbi:MAG TPA: hypothetical protein VH280_05855 [Verrucomicrobiae bacterium]|nr:hypothetical protein [Verrucomicrobiae bacterium]
MKSLYRFVLAAAFLLGLTGIAAARIVSIWSYQELLEKSTLVVIATPAATNDTKEHIDLPGFNGEHVIGVETRFTISAVLKGNKALRAIVLHHYRTADGVNYAHVVNGPSFVYFAAPGENPTSIHRTYVLFLLREADGRYAPVVGQTDPGLAVKELEGVYASAVTETQTKLGIDIANALRQCQSIRAGMTRAELSKVFYTEGGLSTVTHRTYVYRDCPYIKVDVDFAPSAPKQDVEKPTDNVIRISKPYLDWSVAD